MAVDISHVGFNRRLKRFTMAVNINHVDFNRRFTRVQQLLHDYGLQVANISPLAYCKDYPLIYKSFLYKVELAEPALASNFPGTQPGTCAAPSEGVSVLVVKLSNALAYKANNSNRVENDVAAQKLVREYLEDPDNHTIKQVVPNVYAWAPAAKTTHTADEKGFGWIMSEFRSGVKLSHVFQELQFEDQVDALKQIKNILRAVRFASLPKSVTKFGGSLTFNSKGQIVDGESPIKEFVKPADSYLEHNVDHLHAELVRATESPVIQGWEGNGVIARIKAFLDGGGPEKLLAEVDTDSKGQALIHYNLTTDNLLWDQDKKEITAVLDFEFCRVNHPFEEFDSLSFKNFSGSLAYETADSIREALISGDFNKTPADIPFGQWMFARVWNAVLDDLAPSKINGVRGIVDLVRLHFLLCPFSLSMEVISKEYDLETLTDEKKAELRAEAEAELVEWLEKHGF